MVLALLACESDEKKLERLRGDQTMYCLLDQKYQRDYEEARLPKGATLPPPPPTPRADSLGRLWVDYKNKCELATRDYNRFMR